MKIFQVTIEGEGFVRNGAKMKFELGGFVKASDPNEAFFKAVDLAKKEYPELGQADKKQFPGPVINADEIQEFSEAPASEIDKVEIYWSEEGDV